MRRGRETGTKMAGIGNGGGGAKEIGREERGEGGSESETSREERQ
jgi:hypothetical protein